MTDHAEAPARFVPMPSVGAPPAPQLLSVKISCPETLLVSSIRPAPAAAGEAASPGKKRICPPSRPAPAMRPGTLVLISRFVTGCWNTAPVSRLGTPSRRASPVKASIAAQTNWSGPPSCCSSR